MAARRTVHSYDQRFAHKGQRLNSSIVALNPPILPFFLRLSALNCTSVMGNWPQQLVEKILRAGAAFE
jgi:hypothetical protein